MSREAANGTPVLDHEHASPSPSPSGRPTTAAPLFFAGTSPEPAPEPRTPADQLGEGSPFASDAGSDSAGAPSDPHDSREPTGPRASSAESLASRGQLRETFRAGVQMSSVAVHQVAARTEGQREAGLYLADDDDAKAIGHPLADITHRRGGLTGSQLSPDAADALKAVMGVVGYLGKQFRGMQVARQIDQQYAHGLRGPAPAPAPEQQPAPEPEPEPAAAASHYGIVS